MENSAVLFSGISVGIFSSSIVIFSPSTGLVIPITKKIRDTPVTHCIHERSFVNHSTSSTKIYLQNNTPTVLVLCFVSRGILSKTLESVSPGTPLLRVHDQITYLDPDWIVPVNVKFNRNPPLPWGNVMDGVNCTSNESTLRPASEFRS